MDIWEPRLFCVILRHGLLTGNGQYVGLLQDIRYYQKGLTNREIIEAMTGLLPEIPYTYCHCPETHPRLAPSNYFYCMKNDANSNDMVLRLSENSHPPEYLVDGLVSYWISEMVPQVTLTIDLKYANMQVYLVNILFYSPPPQGIVIERSTNFGISFQPWQYYALDCISTFGMENNGQLLLPNSVNCLQISNPKPSWENMMFETTLPGPEKLQRPFGVPGCLDFNCSPLWVEFVRATNVRIKLSGHTLVNDSNHQYFGVRRIVIGGTCDCHGHGSDCTYLDNAKPYPKYICACDPRTFTEGEQCDRCLPLYNDKPFLRGTIFKANPCKKCQCNNHADSCSYYCSLDANFNSRNSAGGGVCNSCKHNTMGRYCENCKPLYYRPKGKNISSIDVCQPCNCVGPGVVFGNHNCQQDDSTPGIEAGQCNCKKYATGLQCTECEAGYFQLSATNLEGCTQCNCDTAGTVSGQITCHISSGQCVCKQNVIGVTCSKCQKGYYGLSSLNPLGCYPCNCNPFGSLAPDECNSLTGQCTCKDKFEGRACDRCAQGFFGPNCQPCACNINGTMDGTQCNKDTGQCFCKQYVTGTECNTCLPGFFNLSKTNFEGCSPCNCVIQGTILNKGECYPNNGSCLCKKYVTGRTCNLCKAGTFGLTDLNEEGCAKCNCDSRGTWGGDVTPKGELNCSSVGQCNCRPNVTDTRCNKCIDEFYWNSAGFGCLPCECNLMSSLSNVCNNNGSCECKPNIGVDGMRCDKCAKGYFNFSNGKCSPCKCNNAGSLFQLCDDYGNCTQCKANVVGMKCDVCKLGTTSLEDRNPYGCSGAPSQQGAPFVLFQTSRLINIGWFPPDNLNGILIKYELYRDRTKIFVGLDNNYTDNNLKPYTYYSYNVISYTAGGSSVSDNGVFRTSSDIPVGVHPVQVSEIKGRSLIATWQEPDFPNGVILEYILESTSNFSNTITQYIGFGFFKLVTGLSPYTTYNFTLKACTDKGCSSSVPISIITLFTAPDSQPAPHLLPLPGGTSVIVFWDAPEKPNGQIQFYEIFIRTEPFLGDGNLIASNLSINNLTFKVENLKPFLYYEFRVVSYTSILNSVSSNWSKIRTSEGVPAGENAIYPFAEAINSTAVKVIWNEPSSPNGIIVKFELYRYSLPNIETPILVNVTKNKEWIDIGLLIYTLYKYSVIACNTVGCTNYSTLVSVMTKSSAPQGQSSPISLGSNSTSIELAWSNPSMPNGPLEFNFVVELLLPSFSYPPPNVEQGIRFPGFGYYKLEPSFMADDSTTVIQFFFKTNYLNGLIFFAASKGQEDMISIELREGRPWFIFDTESGATAFTISTNQTFNDNMWHNVFVERLSREGKILVDGIYFGSGTGGGLKNIIGQIEDVYIGSLPEDFKLIRVDNGTAVLRRLPFIGCLKDFQYNGIPIKFNSSISKSNVSPLSVFCPVSFTSGLYFKDGGYLVLKSLILKEFSRFKFQLRLRTVKQTALVFFSYGQGVKFFIYFQNATLYLSFKTPSDSGLYTLSSTSICDGQWHLVEVEILYNQLNMRIDNNQSQVATLPSDFLITSELYLGGIPESSYARTLLFSDDIIEPFSGCIDMLSFTTIDYIDSVKDFYNIEFDGCPQTPNDVFVCKNSLLSEVYKGKLHYAIANNLQDFTEYLVRVKSFREDEEGFAISMWSSIHTAEGVPKNFLPPNITNVGAYSVKLIWTPPLISSGLIRKYVIYGYIPSVGENISKILQGGLVTESEVENLSPATLYLFKIEVFTGGGSTESNQINVTTLPSVPEMFSPPIIETSPTSFNISWRPPIKPNGEIIFYKVELNDVLYYTGKSLFFYIENLTAYTLYTVKLSACGFVGCVSVYVDQYTGETPPEDLMGPTVQVLDSVRIEVLWSPPNKPNGKIFMYQLFVSLSNSLNNMNLISNTTKASFAVIVENLVPGTLYFVRVKAFNNKGSVISNSTEVRTLESAPTNIPPPKVTPVGSTILLVKIYPPNSPNGVVKNYYLWQDGVIVLNWGALPNDYVAQNLKPYTQYLYQVQVCTGSGCGFSPKVIGLTGQEKPNGTIQLLVQNITSYSLTANWTSSVQPNGPLIYYLIVKGSFNLSGYETVNMSVICFETNNTDETALCTGLLAYTIYDIIINASNNAGFILSNSISVKTLSDIPEGFSLDNCSVINSTSVYLTWRKPSRPNGKILSYYLYILFQLNDMVSYRNVLIKRGLFYDYTFIDLSPYSVYSFKVEVENDFANLSSICYNVTTPEDVPSDFDAPNIVTISSRYAIAYIFPPAKPNGVIISYKMFLNSTLIFSSLQTVVNITNLMPYTVYTINVAACTIVGCIKSSSVFIETLMDAPEDVYPPILSANGSRSVIVQWRTPKYPNGIILLYKIQRGKNNSSLLETVNSTQSQFWNIYIDFNVKPNTLYKYRIVAQTAVGASQSEFSLIQTPEAEPEGIEAPLAFPLSTYSILIKWKPPSEPNGKVIKYVVKINQQTKEINDSLEYIVTGLLPYILYYIKISVCTVVGCTDSAMTSVRTLPAAPSNQPSPIASVLSSTSLRVQWTEPLYPNGPITGFVLYGRTLESLVNENISFPTKWQTLVVQVATVFDHLNLGIFSLHDYMVTCITNEGNTTSNVSETFRTRADIPLLGPNVTVVVLNHVSVNLSWIDPPLTKLRGKVIRYTVYYEIVSTNLVNTFGNLLPKIKFVVINNLKPNTEYIFKVELFNGAGSYIGNSTVVKTNTGVPEGLGVPVVYRIGSFDLSIAWAPPLVPNGLIVNYTVVINNELLDTLSGDRNFCKQENLKPYTVYIIQIQVCNQFGCALSNSTLATTLSAAPSGMETPSVKSLSSTSIQINWKPPLNVNGVLIGYKVFRRAFLTCSGLLATPKKCLYIECKINEAICGASCYDPQHNVCCNQLVYKKDSQKVCCNNHYAIKNTTSDICCGDSLYPFQVDYQCCYGYYTHVPDGYVCCSGNNGIIVGIGDSCCSDVPYSINGTKVCVCGNLYDRQPTAIKCCGGKTISMQDVCCGDEIQGVGYGFDPSKMCCGTKYLVSQNTLCCTNSFGEVQAYIFNSSASFDQHKCCGTTYINSTELCCNYVGYNNVTDICANLSTYGVTGCGNGTSCLRSNKMSLCDNCNFNKSNYSCYITIPDYDPIISSFQSNLCPSDFTEILNNSQNASILTFIDNHLMPHTKYEYYIVVFNDAGNASSALNMSITEMGQPENLEAPVPTVLSSDKIFVIWSLPNKPNGQISEYILYRLKWSTKEERLVYRGLQLSFLDMDGLEPYTGYLYILSACTVSCTNISASVLAYTEEAIPVGVQAPLLQAISSNSIQVNWSTPTYPNGKIIFYNVTILVKDIYRSLIPNDSIGEMMSLTVSGLLPYNSYTFKVYACTSIGCSSSPSASATTLQAAPESILPPQITIINARMVELEWSPPKSPNGIILSYVLKRNLTVIYNGMQLNLSDVSVLPATLYIYTVGASTLGGYTESNITVVRTPESTPQGIALPNLYALSSSSINVSWSMPALSNGILISYTVYYQESDSLILKKPASLNFSVLITQLKTFTLYFVRIEACTIVGCGSSDKASVRTLEEPPVGQQSPTLFARGTTIVEISWVQPLFPNGIILNYQVERRSSMVSYIIYVGLRTDYIDTQLTAYTEYEYRVRSVNSKGESISEWSKVRTFEGVPENVQPPFIEVLNSSSIFAKWDPPTTINGILIEYSLQIRLFSQPQLIEDIRCCIKPSVTKVQVDGLLPFTSYEFRVVASTFIGSSYSPWVLVRLPEALPSGIPDLIIRPLNDTTSLEVLWDEPTSGNGIITNYVVFVDTIKVYEGISRRTILRKVLSFTNYTFQLKVCNSVGCVFGLEQIYTTGDIKLNSIPKPGILFINASVILLSWIPLDRFNISSYQVIRESLSLLRNKRSVSEIIICSLNITSQSTTTTFQCTDTSVKPYQKYRYRIYGYNDQTIIESDWVEVTTAESVPEYVLKPNLTALVGPSVYIQWFVPPIPNGLIHHYEVVRNGSFIISTFMLSYIDINILLPNMQYEYKVKACTNVGCTLSPPSNITTLSLIAGIISPPFLTVISSSIIKAEWLTPNNLSIDIAKYRLFMNKQFTPIFEGYAFVFTVVDLKPFTRYLFNIAACSYINCFISITVDAFTKEAPPEYLRAPFFDVLGTHFIEVRWTAPSKPNGIILFYILKRDNLVLYNGTGLNYIDYNIYPASIYSYKVIAFNSVGWVESKLAFVKTSEETFSAPLLQAISSNEVNVTWLPWLPPNGSSLLITSYKIMYADIEFNVGMVFQYLAKNLTPYTKYDFQIKACFKSVTDTQSGGCVTSATATITTLEASPENLRAPYFFSEEIRSNSIIVRWDYPLIPNGEIMFCELFRKRNDIIQLYKGLSTLYLDNSSSVVPNTRYEYKVSCNNSIGGISSLWSAVSTISADDTILLIVTNKTATSFAYEIILTSQLMSPIKTYLIEIRNFKFNITTTNQQGNVSDLKPYTEYTVRVYGCNEVGCLVGKFITFQTDSAAPQGFDFPPELVSMTSREIEIKWSVPKYPNGIIIQYNVLLYHPCPQLSNQINCVVESNIFSSGILQTYKLKYLTPFTEYEIKVIALNSMGSTSSQVLKVTTESEVPVVLQQPLVYLASNDQSTIIVSWANVFDLRSRLIGYFVTENNLLAYSGTSATNLTRPNRPPAYYSYVVTAETFVNNTPVKISTSSVGVLVGNIPTVVPTTITTTGAITPSAGLQSNKIMWYQTVWFLALCAFVFVLFVFVIIVCCCRGYRKNKSVYVRERQPLPMKFKYKSRASSLNEFTSPECRRQSGFERCSDVPMSRNSTPRRGYFKEINSERNNNYCDDDLIWHMEGSRRDLDSGLYDDFDPVNFENEFEEQPIRDRTFTTNRQSERFILPDTRL
nr:usherin isoform X3 [Hydra vulgaris]